MLIILQFTKHFHLYHNTQFYLKPWLFCSQYSRLSSLRPNEIKGLCQHRKSQNLVFCNLEVWSRQTDFTIISGSQRLIPSCPPRSSCIKSFLHLTTSSSKCLCLGATPSMLSQGLLQTLLGDHSLWCSGTIWDARLANLNYVKGKCLT